MAKFDSDWDNPEVSAPIDDTEDSEPQESATPGEASQSALDGFSDDDVPEEDAADSNRRFMDEEVEHYRKELDEDLRLTHPDGSLDLTAFKTKTFMESATRGKWLSYLYKEKEILTQLNRKTAEFGEAVKAKMMAGTGSGFEKRQKVEEFFKSSPAMAKLKEATAMQQRKIDFLTEANEIMSKFGYSIRNGIDFLKLQFS